MVVFDNLGAHRPQRVRKIIEAKGAEVLFLPSYSPDLNPIEEAFAKRESRSPTTPRLNIEVTQRDPSFVQLVAPDLARAAGGA